MSATRIAQAAIKIPKRIERGPTDILKALASTVKYQPSHPSALQVDDGYLVPRGPRSVAVCTLARLSGRNTAKFLLNKHPELFYRDDAEPKIPLYNPPEEFREDMNFTTDDLTWCIEHKDPVNGCIAYRALIEKEGVKLDQELLLQFFEMICFTNEDPVLDRMAFQKQFFARDSERLSKQNWLHNGIASKIFNQIKQDVDPTRVYSAMICGLCRHNEHKVAREVFDEFREFKPDHGLVAEAYQHLIASIPNLESSAKRSHASVQSIVEHMEAHLVRPNLKVFNSILDVYKRFRCDADTVKLVFQLFADMQSLKIEPSLYTCACLILILSKEREVGSNREIISTLLNYMLHRPGGTDVRDERDSQSFLAMMNVFAKKQVDLALANQVLDLQKKSPTLFQNDLMRNIFFDVYFELLLSSATLDKIMAFYDSHVPHSFRPSVENYDGLAEALDVFQASDEIVFRVGRDINSFRIGDKITNDQIFRKDPDFVKKQEESLEFRKDQ